MHDARELTEALRVGADLFFVSPVFSTASHPQARPMGVARFGLLVGGYRHRAIALGGVNFGNIRRLRGMNSHGWAAIDAFKRA